MRYCYLRNTRFLTEIPKLSTLFNKSIFEVRSLSRELDTNIYVSFCVQNIYKDNQAN